MNRRELVVGRSARVVKRSFVDMATVCAAGPRAGEPSAPGGRIQGAARGSLGMPTITGRRGFTLVELLAVIVIIGLIAAIAVPVVMQSLARARNAAIKAEIDMLHMAIMNYKAEYGSFPPCSASLNGSDDGSRHILRIFPRTTNIATEVSEAPPIQPHNALVSWLNGYTTDPTSPLKGSSGRQKLFDFDRSRLDDSQLIYFPSKKAGSPYVYITSGTASGKYGTVASRNTYPSSNANYNVEGVTRSIPAGTYAAELETRVAGTVFFNADTFQILCAGRDEEWNTDDDLSNFWPGTRREYVESQK